MGKGDKMNRQEINTRLECIKNELKQLQIAVANNLNFNVYPDFREHDHIVKVKLEVVISILK